MRCLLLTLTLAAPSFADDWPQWRGPRGDNVSLETNWTPAGKDAPAWRAPVGTGYSSPVIADGLVYIQGYFAGEEDPKVGVDRVSCLSLESGELLWSKEYAAKVYDNEHQGGALSTSTVFDGVLYMPTRDGEVRAFDARTGELRWEANLVERHGVSPGRYGFASAPYVLGDSIVLNASKTVRLNRATGETEWISESYDANYSTVREITVRDTECLVVFGGKGVVLLNAADGSEVAQQTFRKGFLNVEGSTPIVMGTRVFVATGYDQGGLLVDFAGEEPEELWRTRVMRNKMAGCTLFEDHLYGFDESMLKCMDLEGKEVWRKRGLGQGAMTIAGGRIVTTTSRGQLVIAEASPEGYVELARKDVTENGGVYWSTPVVSNGRIFVRGSYGELVCFDHRTADSATAGADVEATGPLPTPAALVAAHLEKSKLAGVDAMTWQGRLFIKALGFDDVDATFSFDGKGRCFVRMGFPKTMGEGSVDRIYNGDIAWNYVPWKGNILIEGLELDEVKRTRGFRGITAPITKEQLKSAESIGYETFGGAKCVRVDVQISKDHKRSVFFDAKSGLYAGRTSEAESTVFLGDWRKLDDKLVPYKRTIYDLESGQEQRWVFETVTWEGASEEVFEVPDNVRREDD